LRLVTHGDNLHGGTVCPATDRSARIGQPAG
jgi:hypothetical protein